MKEFIFKTLNKKKYSSNKPSKLMDNYNDKPSKSPSEIVYRKYPKNAMFYSSSDFDYTIIEEIPLIIRRYIR